MEDKERKSPYHGLWIIVVIGLGMPVIAFLAFRWIMFNNAAYPTDYIISESIALAGVVGTLIMLGFVVAGGISKPFKIAASRIKELIEDFSISKREAFRWYWYRVKTEGIVLWIVLLILIANIVLLLVGVTSYLELRANM